MFPSFFWTCTREGNRSPYFWSTVCSTEHANQTISQSIQCSEINNVDASTASFLTLSWLPSHFGVTSNAQETHTHFRDRNPTSPIIGKTSLHILKPFFFQNLYSYQKEFFSLLPLRLKTQNAHLWLLCFSSEPSFSSDASLWCRVLLVPLKFKVFSMGVEDGFRGVDEWSKSLHTG